jgi:nucleoside-diphosphate-sugar epimerase
MTTSPDTSHGWTLLTGGAGFLGTGFLDSLPPAERARCVCIVRKTTPQLTASVGAVIEGFFGDPATLQTLAAYPVTSVVHLAAVTGGCSEADGIAVNVEGTRVLLRHLSDQGCRRFVLASSIAAVGLQRTDFIPHELPMTETHPCVDKDGYGFSKYLMEQIAAYHHRQNPSLAIFTLRFGVIVPDDAPPGPFVPSAVPPAWTYAHFSKVRRRDVVRAVRLALTRPSDGECSVLNIVARQPDLGVTIDQLLKTWHPGHTLETASAAAFSTEAAERRLGFTADWP